MEAKETQRLNKLRSYDILDTPREEDYNEVVQIASAICKTPISLISLIDADRQWFKAAIGLEEPETPREVAFCAHAIELDDLMTVFDALQDDRFRENPLVRGSPNIRFYAGMPLTTPDGFKLGTLCVIDDKPRELDDFQKEALRVLARQVMNQLELRYKARQLQLANARIAEQNHMLQETVDSKNKLLSILAHDMRSPLASLYSMANILEYGGLGPEEIADFSKGLSTSVKNTLGLLDNLLNWVRAQFGPGGVEIKPIELRSLADRLISQCAEEFEQKGNRVHNNIPEGTQILSSESLLAFSLRNIMLNANKFTKDGHITLSFMEDAERCGIGIQDTGVGMTTEQAAAIFDWDKKIYTTGTAGEKGSGLAMKLCSELLSKIGGRIAVESAPGRGSRFTILLPK